MESNWAYDLLRDAHASRLTRSVTAVYLSEGGENSSHTQVWSAKK